MAELKHRLYFIKRIHEGMRSIKISFNDAEVMIFHQRYAYVRDQYYTCGLVRDVMKEFEIEGKAEKVSATEYRILPEQFGIGGN